MGIRFAANEWLALPIGAILSIGFYHFLCRRVPEFGAFQRRFFLGAFMLRFFAGSILLLVYGTLVRGADLALYYHSTALLIHQLKLDFSNGLLLWWYGWPKYSTVPSLDLVIEYPQAAAVYGNETSFWVERRPFVLVRLLVLLWWPAGGSSLVLTFYCAAIAFVGIWLFYNELVRVVPTLKFDAAAALFIVPGVVIWSSGLLKEPWIFGAQCAVLGLWLRGFRTRRIQPFILLILLLGLIGLLRPLIALLLGSLLALEGLIRLLRRSLYYWAVGAGVVLAIAVVFYEPITQAVQMLLSNLEYNRWYALRYGHRASIPFSETSGFDLGSPQLGWGEAWRWIRALAAALFYPFPWQADRWIEIPLACENFFILISILYNIFYIDSQKIKDAFVKHPLFFTIIFFSLLWLLITGLSTPYAGSLWRYRLHAIPFLLVGLAAFRREKHPFRWIMQSKV